MQAARVLAGVHKTLVSAAKVNSSKITVLDKVGGIAVDERSVLGQKLRGLIGEELKRDPGQEALKLYVGRGVYNFYLQDENLAIKI